MTFRPFHDPEHSYFVTATLLNWKPLFAQPAYARIVLDSLDWHRRQRRWLLFAYVVMPHHAHLIIKPLEPQTISSVLQSLGSFTAHAILRQIALDGYTATLEGFAHRQDGDASKQHQVWQPLQVKNAYSARFLYQKMEYIHNNPVAHEPMLVEDRADYEYSSARFYDRDEQLIVEVDDIRGYGEG